MVEALRGSLCPALDYSFMIITDYWITDHDNNSCSMIKLEDASVFLKHFYSQIKYFFLTNQFRELSY